MKSVVVLLLCFATYAYAHPSVSILMDSKGNVYYSDLARVWKITPRGEKQVAVEGVHTHEIYIDRDDNVYGEHLWYNGERAGTWSHYLWKYSPDGKFEKIKSDSEGFLTDYSFIHDGKDNMYFADRDNKNCQHIIRRNVAGTPSRLGSSCFTNIRWMTVSTEGNLYVIDFHDLKKVDERGNVTTLAADLPQKKLSQIHVDDQHYLSGVSTDKNENVYVADYSGRALKKVDKAGKVSTVVRTSIPWSPAGSLLAPNGDFWILECSITNAVRVERITPSGNRIIY